MNAVEETLYVHFYSTLLGGGNDSSLSRETIIDYLKVNIYNNCNYSEIRCSPELCLVIESDKDFYTNNNVSFYDMVENDSAIGKHCGFNVRRDIKLPYNFIQVLDKNEVVVKTIKIVNTLKQKTIDNSLHTRLINDVKETYDILKQSGRVLDYEIEEIDTSNPKEPKAIVKIVLNKPVDNIKLEFKIEWKGEWNEHWKTKIFYKVCKNWNDSY